VCAVGRTGGLDKFLQMKKGKKKKKKLKKSVLLCKADELSPVFVASLERLAMSHDPQRLSGARQGNVHATHIREKPNAVGNSRIVS